MKKLFRIFAILIIAISCNESNLSQGKVEHLSLIRAEIYIYQSLHNKQVNQVVVDLFDEKGRTIKNDSIKIYVNGEEVKYTVQQGLYYTSSTYYLKDSATPRDNKFAFEIALTDGKKIFLAETQALELVSSRNIICSEKGDLNKDLEVKWKELAGVNQLEIGKSVKLKKKEDPHVTTFEERAPDTISIHSTGNYVIPKSTFDNAEGQISAVSFKFIARKTGNVNPLLLKGSSIVIQGNIEERVWFE